ncbi:MAG TPA: hypothetical protein VIF62_06765 [Labilithrix sp.]|jgi:hypothetical protein
MTDVLDDAFAALRAEAHGTSDDARATRSAILLGAARARRTRSIVVRFVLPAAAVLVATSAWAAATGRIPRRVVELFVEERTEPERMPEPPKKAAVTPIASIVVAAPSASVELSPAPAPAPPPSAPDPEDRTFRRAHEAHFAVHDWNAALADWDAYLAAYPNGRFVPEARYNRAIALVRLGRRDEARAALRPFADGAFGTYRQSEARQLLDALE